MDYTRTEIWRRIFFDTELPFNDTRVCLTLVTIFPDEKPEEKIQIVYRMDLYIESELEKYMECFPTNTLGFEKQNFELPWEMFTSGIFIRLLSLLRLDKEQEQVTKCYTLIFHHFEDFRITKAGIEMSKEAGFYNTPLLLEKTGLDDTYHICATLNRAGKYTVKGNQIEGNAYGHRTCFKKNTCTFTQEIEMGDYCEIIRDDYIRNLEESKHLLDPCIKKQTEFFNTMMEKKGLITFKAVDEELEMKSYK